jgi:predicted MFS family arabinose efflux permease
LGEAGLAIAGGCLIATGLSLLLGTHHTVGALCACLVTGMGLYMLHNVLQTQATQMAPDNRSTALTMFASLLFLGQSCGVVVLSWSVDANVLHETLAAFAVAVVLTGLAASRQSPGKATQIS